MVAQQQQKDKTNDEIDSQLLDLARVGRMTAGGRRLRFRATVAAGDEAGQVGIGVAKANDAAQSIDKATRLAKKNMQRVTISEGTVPHEVSAKYGAAEVLLKPQSAGRGLIAGGVVRRICQLAGIEDVSGKILGNTRNNINNARATLRALSRLQDTAEEPESSQQIEEET